MIHPSYVELMKVVNDNAAIVGEEPVVNSRYSIVSAAAKRARQIIDGAEPMYPRAPGEKPLSIAVKEMYEKKLVILTDEEAKDQEIKVRRAEKIIAARRAEAERLAMQQAAAERIARQTKEAEEAAAALEAALAAEEEAAVATDEKEAENLSAFADDFFGDNDEEDEEDEYLDEEISEEDALELEKDIEDALYDPSDEKEIDDVADTSSPGGFDFP